MKKLNILQISFLYLKEKPIMLFLQILLMALSMMIITSLLLFSSQINQKFYRNLQNIDAVVGAKGSGLQLILSTIQHIDVPTGNISYQDYLKIKQNRKIKEAIPISLGDNFGGFRIIGSDKNYIKHFATKLKSGKFFDDKMQAVIGYDVMKKSGLRIGDIFYSNHGLIGGVSHQENPFRVVGILQKNNSVLDRLIVVNLESVWGLHDKISKNEITAILVKYRNRSAHYSFLRQINKNTNIQAASPAFEMARLSKIIGFGTKSIMIFAALLVIISLTIMFLILLNNVRKRRYDLAIFRIFGASKKQIFLLIIFEGMIIAIISSLVGIIFGHLLLAIISFFEGKIIEIGVDSFIFLPQIYLIWLLIMAISFLICLIPAIQAYKIDIKKLLLDD